MTGSSPSLAATCEDYNSDDSEIITGTKKQANVAAKRTSHPSNLGREKDLKSVDVLKTPDHHSDSGYSSHTQGTMNSADSHPSPQAGGIESKPKDAVSPTPAKKRPTVMVDTKNVPGPSDAQKTSEKISSSKSSSSKTPASARSKRAPSKSRPQRSEQQRVEECTDPACVCRRKKPSPLDSKNDVKRTTSTRAQRSPVKEARPPPAPRRSPTEYRQSPTEYRRPGTVMQSAQSRRRTSSASRGRPVSYHGGTGSEGWVQYPYVPTPTSAYANNQMVPYGSSVIGATPPGSGFYPPSAAPYDPIRPSLRVADTYSTRGPAGPYGQPLVTYGQNAPAGTRISARYPNKPPTSLIDEEPDSSGESESEPEEEEVSPQEVKRALIKAAQALKGRRPSVRETKAAETIVRKALAPTAEQEHAQSTAWSSIMGSRSGTARRPSLSRKPNAYAGSAGGPKVTIESGGRRLSYLGHEPLNPELQVKRLESELDAKRREAEADVKRREAELQAKQRVLLQQELEQEKRKAEAFQKIAAFQEQLVRRAATVPPQATAPPPAPEVDPMQRAHEAELNAKRREAEAYQRTVRGDTGAGVLRNPDFLRDAAAARDAAALRERHAQVREAALRDAQALRNPENHRDPPVSSLPGAFPAAAAAALRNPASFREPAPAFDNIPPTANFRDHPALRDQHPYRDLAALREPAYREPLSLREREAMLGALRDSPIVHQGMGALQRQQPQPLTATALGQTKSKPPPSDTSSTRSRASSTHVSRVTTTAEGGFKMSVDASRGVELEFDGRMISLKPQQDGRAELIIGERRTEKRYIEDGTVITSRVESRIAPSQSPSKELEEIEKIKDKERLERIARLERAEHERSKREEEARKLASAQLAARQAQLEKKYREEIRRQAREEEMMKQQQFEVKTREEERRLREERRDRERERLDRDRERQDRERDREERRRKRDEERKKKDDVEKKLREREERRKRRESEILTFGA